MNTTTYIVPKAFWEDHIERACRCAESCPDREIHSEEDTYGVLTSKGYRVELNEVDLAELISDARHYSNVTQWSSPENIGLQSSARATVRRLTKPTEGEVLADILAAADEFDRNTA